MFKFDFFKNINKPEFASETPESVTTNTSESTSEEVDQVALESLNTPEISYKSPEYLEVAALYETNKEVVAFALENYLENIEENIEENENSGLYSYSEGAEGVEVFGLEANPDEVVEEPVDEEGVHTFGVGNEKPEHNFKKGSVLSQTLLVLGTAISAAALFAFVVSRYGNKGDKELLHSATSEVKRSVSEVGGGIKEVAKKVVEVANDSVDKAVEAVKTPPKEELDSTTIHREPNIENVKKYSKELVPSGDFEKGLINLCDATEKAQAEGILRYFPNGHVFAIEGMKHPREQGISIRALAFYKLHKGLSPRPLMAGASFKNYTKEQKGDLRTFNVEKFKEDLRKAVPKSDFTKNGKFDSEKYNEVVSVFIEANMETYKALLEWSKSNPQQKEKLYETETKPLEGRTGAINPEGNHTGPKDNHTK